ncbi:MAG: M6 family metalloprotease domain-containing protein [Planctomycetes bacterium]|nr:M6 family metalloprotease domain-containing protein [Planctomycetota bacterium]MBL7037635.1 M6 family metalloprotease domain-containing protein [Pirellulaceae bacterium]
MSAIFGERIILQQDDGSEVTLVVTGDEFHADYETLDGYTAVFDQRTGKYCYGELVGGALVSTGLPVTKAPPVGLRPHLQESGEIRAARFAKRFNNLRPPEDGSLADENMAFAFAPNNGLLNGRRVSDGHVLGLTIMVEFQDVAASVDRDDVNAMLNADDFDLNGNISSVRRYFSTVSNGNLDYENRVVGPVKLSKNKKFYETTLLVREALEAAVDQFNVDLSDFVSQDDGVIDAVNFMYAGRTVYGINGDNSNPSDLWPHNSSITLEFDTPAGRVKTHFYQLSSMGRRRVDLSIGTFCHESGHLLCRFPDMYDYGKREGDFFKSLGIGPYCLMGSGNHNGSGRTPAPVCGYLRDLVGWADREVLLNASQTIQAKHADYGTVLKFLTDKSNEYFVIENRTAIGLDEHLGSSGLAILHCDILGSNELQQGTAAQHYQCALLQADGRRDLEKGISGNRASDLYGETAGVAASKDTNPATRMWDGSDSGLKVSEISGPGEEIAFRVGEPVVPPIGGQATVSAEVEPDLLIPDDEPAGITSALSLAPNGDVVSIEVDVEAQHTWVGDLTISLEAPSGEEVVLRETAGGSADDVDDHYTSETHEQLAKLVGESVQGDWKLHIIDSAFRDVGRLDRWSLKIVYEQGDKTVTRQMTPNVPIPDSSAGGISDSVTIGQKGILRNVQVRVDITHTWVGDLIVELRSASGDVARLHDRQGRSQDDIRRTYDLTTTPALETMLNTAIKGKWQLVVRDLVSADIGTLNEWDLTLVYSPTA